MAEGDHKQEIIIVRRYEQEEHHHANSTWKVAHADFMTAMMAFFLIMWLLNATDEKSRQEIANYFNPIRLSDNQPNKKGLRDPAEGELSGTEKGGKNPDKKATAGLRFEGPYPVTLGPALGDSATPPEDVDRGDREKAAFQDPYAVLAEIAAEARQDSSPTTVDVMVGATGMAGTSGSEVVRDPFDPVYWQTSIALDAQKTDPAEGAATAKGGVPPPPADAVDATKPLGQSLAAAVINSETAPEPGDAPTPATADDPADVPEAPRKTAAVLAEELAAALGDTGLNPRLEVVGTSEGVLISLTDDIDFSMFPIGSAVPNPQAVVALEKIGRVLATQSGELVLRGHTDSRPFRSETYDNWRLSTARAHMAYYMLMRGGLEEQRFRKIEGFADRDPRDPSDPQAAINRRIDILVREPAA